jgi:hypothetical protein
MFTIQRWTGKAWDNTMCSPYKTMGAVTAHLRKYAWHYTVENPYRIIDFKPKKKVSNYSPKYDFKKWNSDDDMVVKYGAY